MMAVLGVGVISLVLSSFGALDSTAKEQAMRNAADGIAARMNALGSLDHPAMVRLRVADMLPEDGCLLVIEKDIVIVRHEGVSRSASLLEDVVLRGEGSGSGNEIIADAGDELVLERVMENGSLLTVVHLEKVATISLTASTNTSQSRSSL